jgi:hypothetical protein
LNTHNILQVGDYLSRNVAEISDVAAFVYTGAHRGGLKHSLIDEGSAAFGSAGAIDRGGHPVSRSLESKDGFLHTQLMRQFSDD